MQSMECRVPPQYDRRTVLPLCHADVPQLLANCHRLPRRKTRIYPRTSRQHVRHLGVRYYEDVCGDPNHVARSPNPCSCRLPFHRFPKQTFGVLPVLLDSRADGSGCYRYGLLPL